MRLNGINSREISCSNWEVGISRRVNYEGYPYILYLSPHRLDAYSEDKHPHGRLLEDKEPHF